MIHRYRVILCGLASSPSISFQAVSLKFQKTVGFPSIDASFSYRFIAFAACHGHARCIYDVNLYHLLHFASHRKGDSKNACNCRKFHPSARVPFRPAKKIVPKRQIRSRFAVRNFHHRILQILGWCQLGSPGLSRALRGPFGASWALLGSSGLSWALLGSPGPIWALLGLSWALLGSPGLSRAEVSLSLSWAVLGWPWFSAGVLHPAKESRLPPSGHHHVTHRRYLT